MPLFQVQTPNPYHSRTQFVGTGLHSVARRYYVKNYHKYIMGNDGLVWMYWRGKCIWSPVWDMLGNLVYGLISSILKVHKVTTQNRAPAKSRVLLVWSNGGKYDEINHNRHMGIARYSWHNWCSMCIWKLSSGILDHVSLLFLVVDKNLLEMK